jgi:hypothetical protein
VSTTYIIVRTCDICQQVIPDGEVYYVVERNLVSGERVHTSKADLHEKCQALKGAVIKLEDPLAPGIREIIRDIKLEYVQNMVPTLMMTSEFHRLLRQLANVQ